MRDEAGDKKEIESGRDDNELKNWWVFLTPARRCKNPLPQAAYRILFKSSGGGRREVCLQADQKVESFSYSYSVKRLMGMRRDEEKSHRYICIFEAALAHREMSCSLFRMLSFQAVCCCI